MPLRRPLIHLLLASALTLAGWLALGARSASGQELQITGNCAPAPSTCGGWYRQNVTINWVLNPRQEEGTQVISGCATRTFTADTAGTLVWCEAQLGTPPEMLRRTKTIQLDKTAPTVTGAIPNRPADANGWYRQPVRIDFRGSDATSGIRSCTSQTYAQADTAQAILQGTCRDVAGNSSASSPFRLRYDATAPDITGATPSRPPDHDGWYNRPVSWGFQATDPVSGIAECPPILYDGPAGPAATLTGSCRDRAGNVATRVFPFPYDATAPAPPVLSARPRDRAVRVRVRVDPDVQLIVVRRTPGRRKARGSMLYRGRPKGFIDRRVRNGRKYRYAVTAIDQAGNRARSRVVSAPGPRLLAPAPGAALRRRPLLDWTPVRRARYYNLQLYRGDRKVLTAWPRQSRLQLRKRWRFAGRTRRLVPGTYRWAVWPGYGSPAAARFGARIGRRSFVILEPGI